MEVWKKTYASKVAFESDVPKTKSGFSAKDKAATERQAEIARQAALHLINSGVFGNATKDFTVTLSASDDRATVTISQVAKKG